MFFVFMVVLTVLMFWLFVQTADAKKSIKYKIALAIAILNIILAISSEFAGKKFGEFSKGFILLGDGAALASLMTFANRLFPSKTFVFAIKSIAVATILEVTLFNIPTYRLWSGNYPEMHFSAQDVLIESGGSYDEKNQVIHVEAGEKAVITLKDINAPVGTVYTQAVFPEKTQFGNYSIDLKDETSTGDYRYHIITSHIIKNRPDSAYLHVEASGNVSDMHINIQGANDTGIDLASFSLNVPIPMRLSWVRFWAIVLGSCLIYALFHEAFFQKTLSQNMRNYAVSAFVITCVFCIVGFSMWSAKTSDKEKLWKLESGNQVTQELVDAFASGSVSLLEEPSEHVKEFEQIYDRTQREVQDIEASWDHVYYQGKYYSYYGIAPVILLFLPYHLLTGYYFSTNVAILLFSLIGIMGLTALYSCFVRKFFPLLNVGNAVVCLILLQSACGIWHSLGRMDFYEIATAAGFAFLTWGVYFLLSANIIGKGDISLIKTAASSLLIAIAVLCRPTLALYCICAGFFFLLAFPRRKKLSYLLSALLPMVLLGLGQMWYNYARFGNPFEFGIQYSLTINNFTATEFHWQIAMIPLYNYLINAPVFTTTYPFIHTSVQQMDIGSFFYFDTPMTYSTSGIFWTALPMFAYFLSGRAMRKLPDRKSRISAFTYIGIPCVIIPLVIIALIWESGYATRYIADFGWEMIIGAYAILFFLSTHATQDIVKKQVKIFLCFSMFWALLINGVQIYGQMFRFYDYHYEYPEMAYDLECIFQFWK